MYLKFCFAEYQQYNLDKSFKTTNMFTNLIRFFKQMEIHVQCIYFLQAIQVFQKHFSCL